MRVLRLKIGNWRNLREVDLAIPEDAPLICLVGENGTGKSAVLELLSAAAQQFGISSGTENTRGDPFGEPHEVEIVARVTTDELPNSLAKAEELGVSWDGSLRLVSQKPEGNTEVSVPGIDDAKQARQLANQAIQELRQRKETQHLYLDADRSYPPNEFRPQMYEELLNRDWGDPDFTKQSAFKRSRTLYEEWIKYLIALEEQSAGDLVTEIREARDSGTAEPTFKDPFDNFRALIRGVLPHLNFIGVERDKAQRTAKFDSTGLRLKFNALSGGEREIVFLVGQVDRFRLHRGLLLIDEPELHLNPDLLRTWLSFLRGTVDDGQVWIATHSLEAVEVAGPPATFVFERDPVTRLVSNPRSLAGRPVLSALSAAVGSPAFSLSLLRFVFIEGERQTGERERFYAVCGEERINRFIEGGGCDEVHRRVQAVKMLAAETDEQLKVGGVIDRDFRDARVISEYQAAGLHVLGCHEIENLFLHPDSIRVLLERSGRDPNSVLDVIRDASDRLAGLWIVQRAAHEADKAVENTPREAVTAITSSNWANVTSDWTALRTTSAAEFEPGVRPVWEAALDSAKAEYLALRTAADLWMQCLGKQALNQVARSVGLTSGQVLERSVVKLWSAEVVPPSAVAALKTYLDSLVA